MAAAPDNSGSPWELADPVHVTRSISGTIKTGAGNSQFYSKFGITIHDTNTTPEPTERVESIYRKSTGSSGGGSISGRSIIIKRMTNLDECGSKFPKLEDCAHFHYDFVELGQIQVTLSNENQENLYSHSTPDANPPQPVFHLHVTSREKSWTVRRTYDNLRSFDRQLHRCIFDRKFSLLPELRKNELHEDGIPAMKKLLVLYLNRFSNIAGNMINCGPILSWLECDNRGHRLIVSDDSAINTPAVGAAHVIKRYNAQAPDEISFEVGDIVSIIDRPPGEESVWWRGKKGFEVGFFPADCVEMIGDKLPQSVTSKLAEVRPKPVLRKRGKLISLLRNFFSSRPARTQLKRTGIVKERVFGCDLGEHLLNSGREIPLVLEACAETIESHGIVDGIYRLSGVASNIQKLRNEFDEDREPCLTDECYLQDVHSISSLVKAYFRDLPNPLFTFQLYDKFIEAIQDEENKLIRVHDVIQQLPPPHYRTAKYLMEHLSRVAQRGRETGMHCKNLAIVWAPNLLRSKDLELLCNTAALQGVGVQAIVTEYLISHAELVFSDQLQHLANSAPGASGSLRRGRPKSLALSTPTKLLSLEEARAMVNTSPKQKYLEVGGGPSNLPEKYHTVIDLPNKKKSRKERKSPVSGWRAIFSKGRGQGSKVKDSERSDSVDSTSSAAMGVADEYDIEDTGSRSQRLRPVRSADSLLGESSRPSSHHRYSDISDSSTFINPYADYRDVRPKASTFDRTKKSKATKRSISADNSYSESEMERIIDMSPRDDELALPLDPNPSPLMGLMSELESRLNRRSMSTSPQEIPRSQSQDINGRSTNSLGPASQRESDSFRPQSQFVFGSLDSETGNLPILPKRSKSTALDQTELVSFQVAGGRHSSDTSPEGTLPLASIKPKVKVMSPGKRKKAKAPLPPVAPPRKQQEKPVEAAPRAASMEDLVMTELTESPGVRRKLYSAPSGDLEICGLEGAPSELAAYETNITDDEAFNTQNLSLTTDSDTEADRRESLCIMEGVQEPEKETPLINYDVDTQGHQRHIERESVFGYEPLKTGEPEPGGLVGGSKGIITDTYSSDDNNHQVSGVVSHFTDFDSNSDSHMTMSTNFTVSSGEIPNNTTSDDSDYNSAQIYAENLRSESALSPHLIPKPLVEYSTTSDSDNTREPTTPIATEPVYTTDSDTEIAKTPEDDGTGFESSDRLTPIDLTDSEVQFVDPHAEQEEYTYGLVNSERPQELPLLSGESGRIVIRTPVEGNPEGSLHKATATRIIPPQRLVGTTPNPVPETMPSFTLQGAAGASSFTPQGAADDSLTIPQGAAADGLSLESPLEENKEQIYVKQESCGYDGYFADRSSSASPTFLDLQAKSTKTNSMQNINDITEPVSVQNLDPISEINTNTGIELEPKMHSPISEISTQSSLKKSADSLLFDMEDIDSEVKSRLKASNDKLDLSAEGDDVFFQGSLRAESNMSISPDNYLELNPIISENRKTDIPAQDNSPEDFSHPPAPVEYEVRSAASVERRKRGAEVSRKQSVRELLSRFESSTQSESDDTAKEYSTDSLPREQLKEPSNQQSNLSESMPETKGISIQGSVVPGQYSKTNSLPRKPAVRISEKIRSIQSGSDESDSARSRESLLEPLTVDTKVKGSQDLNKDSSDSERERDPLSTSPALVELRMKFENTETASQKESKTSFVKHAERGDKLPYVETAETESETVNSDKENCDKAPKSLSERMQQYQSRTQSTDSSSDRDSMLKTFPKPKRSVSPDPAKIPSSDPTALTKPRTSLSERLSSLSERFRQYEETPPPPAPEEPTVKNPSTKPPKPAEVKRNPSTKGQFFTRYTHPDKEVWSSGGASGSESDSSVFQKGEAPADGPTRESILLQRRRRFESYETSTQQSKSTDFSSDESRSLSTSESRTLSTSESKEDANMNLSRRARQFGNKSIIIRPTSEGSASSQIDSSWQSDPQQHLDKAATLPRGNKETEPPKSTNLQRNTSDADKHVSVRDLSKQFERQMSGQSDSSRSSLRSSGWNFANDVANGNTACPQTDDSSSNRNVPVQTWTSIL